MIAPIINHYKKLSFQNVENRTALCHCGEEPHSHPACKINFFVDCCIKIKDKNLEGDVAECGVFKGGSARILATVFEDKKILLFDTFTGLPEDDAHPEGTLKKGGFGEVTLDEVKEYLSDKDNCLFYPGWFPKSAQRSSLWQNDKKFSFVHLDMDLYQSTKTGIEFFWKKLVNGGAIIFDDFKGVDTPGIEQSIIEFFENRNDYSSEVYPSMCIIYKKET